MSIQEISRNKDDNYTNLTLRSGKKEAYIYYNHSINQLQVICLNASHKAFIGHGKYYKYFEEAIKNYTSPEMKNMINFARHLILGN